MVVTNHPKPRTPPVTSASLVSLDLLLATALGLLYAQHARVIGIDTKRDFPGLYRNFRGMIGDQIGSGAV